MNRWRKRAEDIRSLAGRARHRLTQERLLRIAEIHDRLANEAERQYQKQRQPEKSAARSRSS